MAHRPNGIPGPFFHFIVVDADEYVKRRGWSGRIKEIKSDYFHHPDALKVSDSVVSLVSDCFRAANPRFYFWGDTEFEGEALTRLETGLRERRETIQAADERMMAEVLNGSAVEVTLEICEVTTTLPELREIIVDSLVGMLRYIHQAQEEKRILLALGP